MPPPPLTPDARRPAAAAPPSPARSPSYARRPRSCYSRLRSALRRLLGACCSAQAPATTDCDHVSDDDANAYSTDRNTAQTLRSSATDSKRIGPRRRIRGSAAAGTPAVNQTSSLVAGDPTLQERNRINSASWMATLPDEAKLDTLYLPGTHQSLALNYPLASSRCQSTSLTTQLLAGIRCLDLRFSLLKDKRGSGGTLWAYHGPVPQGREMRQVLEEVDRFLESEAGRSETVLISIKQENATAGFAAAVWDLIDSMQPADPERRWYDRNEWPTLGHVRGRCVMFCRFGFESGRGLHPQIWPDDRPYAWRTEIAGRDTLVQDWYGVKSPLSLRDKADLVLSLFDPATLEAAAAESGDTSDNGGRDHRPRRESAASPPTAIPFRVNFLSCGTFPTLYPSHAAKGLRFGFKGVNERVAEGLRRFGEDEDRGEEEGEKSATWRGSAAEQSSADDSERRLATLAERWGRKRRDGHGGMVAWLDFFEAPKEAELVKRIIRMNF